MNCRHRPPKQGTPHHHKRGNNNGGERKNLPGQRKARRRNPVQLPCSAPPTPRQCKPLWSLELESFLLPWLKDLSKDRLPGSPSSKISLGAKVSPSSLLIWPG